jgi:hypothetical protein
VPADYDGDGDNDLGVFRSSTKAWYVRGVFTIVWGLDGDEPVPGDYDGDARADLAVFRPPDGQWILQPSTYTTYGSDGRGNRTSANVRDRSAQLYGYDAAADRLVSAPGSATYA